MNSTLAAYKKVLETMTVSGIQTAQICARWSSKGTQQTLRTGYAAYCLMTSPEAMKRYRIFWKATRQIVEILWLVALAIGKEIAELIDRFVQAHLEQAVINSVLDSGKTTADPVELPAVVIEAIAAAAPIAARIVKATVPIVAHAWTRIQWIRYEMDLIVHGKNGFQDKFVQEDCRNYSDHTLSAIYAQEVLGESY